MSTVRKQSTIVTLRLDKTLNDWVTKEAERKSISISQLVNDSFELMRKKFGFTGVVTVATSFNWQALYWSNKRMSTGGVGVLNQKRNVSLSNDNLDYVKKGIEKCGGEWLYINNVAYYVLWVYHFYTTNNREGLEIMLKKYKTDHITL